MPTRQSTRIASQAGRRWAKPVPSYMPTPTEPLTSWGSPDQHAQAQTDVSAAMHVRVFTSAAPLPCRVRFASGPLREIYHTPDGHPSHEGQTARQRRSLNTSYPVDLTAHSIRMLEQELGEPYRLSINRLKRRWSFAQALQGFPWKPCSAQPCRKVC